MDAFVIQQTKGALKRIKKIIETLKLQTKASTFKPEKDIEKNYWFTLNRDDVFKYTGKNFSNFS